MSGRDEACSVKEVMSSALDRDPDQDSLDSDSLGEDAPCIDQAQHGHAASSRTKCFINAADLMDDVAPDQPSARPDVLPQGAGHIPEPACMAHSAPAASEVVRLHQLQQIHHLQQEEKLKGSLLFSGSGCSTPEVMQSPQRRTPAAGPSVAASLQGTGCPVAVPSEPLRFELGAEVTFAMLRDAQRPDVVSGGEELANRSSHADGNHAADSASPGRAPSSPPDSTDKANPSAATSATESPGRRQPPSLDDMPIVAGHMEPEATSAPPPPRRPPDPQQAFFVDLNELPAERPAPPPPRRESDSVYLYIDLNSSERSPPAAGGDLMSLSYHGATAASRRGRTGSATDGAGDEQAEASARSLFYTVGEEGRPRRPPPQLAARVMHIEKRRRNLSLDCQTRGAERQRQSPLLSGDRLARAQRPAAAGTPESARRTAPAAGAGRAAEPPRREGRARVTGRPPPARRPDTAGDRESAASSAGVVPRRRSTHRQQTYRKPAERSQPAAAAQPEKKHTFLRSHSGRNAVSQPPPPRQPAAVTSGASAGGGGAGSGGTLTRRKAAALPASGHSRAAARQQPAPARQSASPRDSPASDDGESDVSSSKSFRRQSPETRNKQGIDELTTDLLQMLSDGIHADVTVQVDGQEVPAHRCILATRCKYFRDLLKEPHLNVVHIDGHKLETVEFVLFHLYSGAMYVPEDVDLSDLITLAVMLQHKQLVRMAEFAMRVRLCHMFHKPCSECIPGVLETLCTAADCDLDDLAARCLAWVTQNRVAVWADPSFSEITDEYRAWCFQEAATLSQDTVLDVLLDCCRLSEQLPAARWSQQVRDMVDTLLSNSVVFLSRNLGTMLVSDRFMSLAESASCAELEQYLLAAADVQNSADAHTSLEMIGQLQSIPNHGWDKAFLGMLQRVRQVCSRRASGGQNYTSLHLQRRTARAQPAGRSASRPVPDPAEPACLGRRPRAGSAASAGEDSPPPPRGRLAESRPGSTSSAESRSPYLRRKQLLGLDRAPAAGGRSNVRGPPGEAMTQSVVADPVSGAAAAEPAGMNRSESFTIYKHE